jgi:hypothetical protein
MRHPAASPLRLVIECSQRRLEILPDRATLAASPTWPMLPASASSGGDEPTDGCKRHYDPDELFQNQFYLKYKEAH